MAIWARPRTDFNPRSRKESDIIRIIIRRNRLPFQSTLSQGERLLPRLTSPPFAIISIHALARRATRPGGQSACTIRHFNPRSRKESDLSAVIIRLLSPAFQSTLSQGERRRVHKDAFQRFIFQSTLSQGERLFKLLLCDTRLIISIHALARRATLCDSSLHGHQYKFQSTLSQGERPSVTYTVRRFLSFQSTLSQGERRYC